MSDVTGGRFGGRRRLKDERIIADPEGKKRIEVERIYGAYWLSYLRDRVPVSDRDQGETRLKRRRGNAYLRTDDFVDRRLTVPLGW